MAKTPETSLVRTQQIAAPMHYTVAMLEYMVYGDVTYSRDLESENKGAHYWRAPRGSGLPDLHRRIYEEHHGPIPKGHHVHHVDLDPTNNHPSNLVALTPSEHRKVHPGHDLQSPENLALLDSIRPLSHESARQNGLYSRIGKKRWEGISPEERAQIVKDQWAKIETKTKPCEWCGEDFTYKRRDARFCSSKCRYAEWSTR